MVHLLKSTDCYCVPSAAPKSTYHAAKDIELQSFSFITLENALEKHHTTKRQPKPCCRLCAFWVLAASGLCLASPLHRPTITNDEAHNPQHPNTIIFDHQPKQRHTREPRRPQACEARRAQSPRRLPPEVRVRKDTL